MNNILYNTENLFDTASVLAFINDFTVGLDIEHVQINTWAIEAVVKGMKFDFPHIDGLEKASPFKKAANFLCYFVAEAPILKSPYIVFDDCPKDLDVLAADIVDTAFPNQGALCVAGTRLLMQAGIRDKLLPKIIALSKALVPQDPLNPDTSFGAIMNEAHMHKVLGYIERAQVQGCELIVGGNQVNQDSGGFYIEPTIFDQVDPNAEIAQEEIFGPVLSIMTFDSEQQAIEIANNSHYGLAAYVATEDMARARRLGRKLNTGILAAVTTSTPTGGGVSIPMEGHKQSGFGMEGGVAGLKAYTVATMVNMYI